MGNDRPNFRIVKPNYESRSDDFHKDFDKGISKSELTAKYDIPKSVWTEWRDRIFEENPKHFRRFRRGRIPKPKKVRVRRDGWVQGTPNRTYTVYRSVNGNRVSYGTYPTKSVADEVHGELVAHNWNPYVAYDLLKENGVPISKRCLLSRIIERKL